MRILCVFVCLIIGLGVHAQFPYHPLPYKQSDFKKIKELNYTKLFVYEIMGDERVLDTEVEYGDQGLIAAMYKKGTNDNGDSVNIVETYYKFDSKGKLIQERETDIESGNGEAVTLFTYDAAGRLIKKQTATIDPPTFKYKYDAKGRLIEAYVTQRMPVYDEQGEFHGKSVDMPAYRVVYKYDAKGRMNEFWTFITRSDPKNTTPDTKLSYTYNDKNQVVKIKMENGEGSEINIQTYTYNANGLIKSRTSKVDDETASFVYEYCKGCKQSWK